MKTYLWCNHDIFEYEFFAANAESVEEARSLVLNKIDDIFITKVKEAENYRDNLIEQTGENISDCALRIFKSYPLTLLKDRVEYRKKILKNEPICLEIGEANMFDHANQ